MIDTLQVQTDSMDFWLPVAVVIFGNSLLFVICSIVKDNSWIDAYWGISFILPIASIWVKRATTTDANFTAEKITPQMILSFSCVCIWGIRLAWHIASRHTKEDFRYVDFRNRWSTDGPFWLYVQFYLKIFIL